MFSFQFKVDLKTCLMMCAKLSLQRVYVFVVCFTDIKGLNNVDRIQQYQNRLLDALMLYTSSHYPNLPTKFGELLLRLSEVQR